MSDSVYQQSWQEADGSVTVFQYITADPDHYGHCAITSSINPDGVAWLKAIYRTDITTFVPNPRGIGGNFEVRGVEVVTVRGLLSGGLRIDVRGRAVMANGYQTSIRRTVEKPNNALESSG